MRAWHIRRAHFNWETRRPVENWPFLTPSTTAPPHLLNFAPDPAAFIVKENPTEIWTALPKDQIPGVVRSYTEALRIVGLVGVPIAGLALIAALMIKNIRIVKREVPAAPPAVDAKSDVDKGAVAEGS
ncbi:hypothetical protein C8R46DRAFT_1211115 [Mycena filopes]|nr:hypothetical protein C8R46DRAFT_1211115 [Mycena filopes]